jgi:hypothetical protein
VVGGGHRDGQCTGALQPARPSNVLGCCACNLRLQGSSPPPHLTVPAVTSAHPCQGHGRPLPLRARALPAAGQRRHCAALQGICKDPPPSTHTPTYPPGPRRQVIGAIEKLYMVRDIQQVLDQLEGFYRNYSQVREVVLAAAAAASAPAPAPAGGLRHPSAGLLPVRRRWTGRCASAALCSAWPSLGWPWLGCCRSLELAAAGCLVWSALAARPPCCRPAAWAAWTRWAPARRCATSRSAAVPTWSSTRGGRAGGWAGCRCRRRRCEAGAVLWPCGHGRGVVAGHRPAAAGSVLARAPAPGCSPPGGQRQLACGGHGEAGLLLCSSFARRD